MNPRELLLFLVTATVALFAGTFFVAKGRLEEWKEISRQAEELRRQIELEQRLVETRGKWEAELKQLGRILPVFPADKKMDVHWLATMDEIAAARGMTISKRQAGEEKKVGDLYELPIECSEWEGTLEALVGFLYDLQEKSGMLDVRQLFVKPKGQGILRGRFSLVCAYAKAEKSNNRTGR
ncbi:MAG: hypothetical protein N2255_09140 [Kiritimatiellae bacterium]|nr:hypothetical protein [Kiritimatiellia bacterium]